MSHFPPERWVGLPRNGGSSSSGTRGRIGPEYASGALLARAHSRMGDAAKIAGYCGKSEALDEALAEFAEAYGDQTETDHASLVRAIRQGRVKAVESV